jgi:hypothetical protein
MILLDAAFVRSITSAPALFRSTPIEFHRNLSTTSEWARTKAELYRQQRQQQRKLQQQQQQSANRSNNSSSHGGIGVGGGSNHGGVGGGSAHGGGLLPVSSAHSRTTSGGSGFFGALTGAGGGGSSANLAGTGGTGGAAGGGIAAGGIAARAALNADDDDDGDKDDREYSNNDAEGAGGGGGDHTDHDSDLEDNGGALDAQGSTHSRNSSNSQPMSQQHQQQQSQGFGSKVNFMAQIRRLSLHFQGDSGANSSAVASPSSKLLHYPQERCLQPSAPICLSVSAAEVIPCICSNRRRATAPVDLVQCFHATAFSAAAALQGAPVCFSLGTAEKDPKAYSKAIATAAGIAAAAVPLPAAGTAATAAAAAAAACTDAEAPFYFAIDCRTAVERELGQFPKAYAFDAEGLADDAEITRLLDMVETMAASAHLCLIGTLFSPVCVCLLSTSCVLCVWSFLLPLIDFLYLNNYYFVVVNDVRRCWRRIHSLVVRAEERETEKELIKCGST